MGQVSARTQGAQARTVAMVPGGVLNFAMLGLDRLAQGLIGLGATANGITIFSVALAGVAGVLLAFGLFGAASVAMVIASLGDALDGLVARKTGTASVGGALLDASADRYEEFFFLGGLAFYFRNTPWMLVLALFALVGSFMVSYGSAKAEALGAPVPPSSMRRAERAVCLCLGAILTPAAEWAGQANHLPDWVGRVPIFAAIGLIAFVANVSALRRLHGLARTRPVLAPARFPERPAVQPSRPHDEHDDRDDSGHAHGARAIAAR
jgi:CDP-diacylglycerol--glycerol-3-phosphate 3-phosphatidyltransferase